MAKQKTKQPQPAKAQSEQPMFMFGKINYILMVAGVVIIAIGFLLMTGAHNDDPALFNEAELYSFRRIVLAPIVILTGLAIEGVAIMIKPKE